MTTGRNVAVILALLAAFGAAALGCSSEQVIELPDGNASAEAEVDDATVAGPSLDETPDSSGPQEVSVDFEGNPALADAYETFADTWLRFVTDENDDRAGDLAELAVPGVVTLLNEWRQLNEALLRDNDLRGSVAKSAEPGFISITEEPDAVVVEDCMRTVDFDSADNETIKYLWQKTTFEERNGDWVVVEFEILNSGEPSTTLTCSSAADESRLVDLVSAYANEAATARRDPSNGMSGDLPELLAEGLKDEWLLELNQAVASGEKWDQEEVHQVEVLGIDPATSMQVAVVELCVIYPDGLSRLSIDGVELPIAAELSQPTRSRQLLEVPLEGADAFLIEGVREYQLGANCGTP